MRALLDKLRPGRAPTAAALTAKADVADLELTSLRDQIAALEQARAVTLLDSSPAEAEAAEATLAASRAQAERVTVVAAELRRRAAEAGEKEQVDGLVREASELNSEAEALAHDLRNRYPALAAEMTALFHREVEHFARRYRLLRQIEKAHDAGLMVPVELPRSPRRMALPEDAAAHEYSGHVGDGAVIPTLSAGSRPLWGGVRL